MTIFQEVDGLLPGQPLVLYELNEVSWRVIDWYVQSKPHSALARLTNRAATFTTVTRDEGELHPWSTWPTLHRGVINTQHNIRFINQSLEPAKRYPPIWETLSKAGRKVGVFGSLQSYPPPTDDAYAFYVPDTFARGCETLPTNYTAFQRFNLRQTQRDGAVASPIRFNTSVIGDILEMLRTGLRLSTFYSIAIHIFKEQRNPLYRKRRSVFQAVVAFDFFQNALKQTKPDFCTFFTNHVAGMMHRYWKHSFPEDFDTVLKTPEERFHAGSIAFAMDVADRQIESLMDYVDARKGLLMVASSMGQEAIDRGAYIGEWRIGDVQKFLKAIGWNAPAQNLLAMQPDFNFSFASESDAEEFLLLINRMVDSAGAPIWKRAQRVGATVNLGLSPSQSAMDGGEAFLTGTDGQPATRLSIAELGMQVIRRDPGTGYHQPEGVLLLYGNKVPYEDSRREVDLTEVRPAILSLMVEDGVAVRQ